MRHKKVRRLVLQIMQIQVIRYIKQLIAANRTGKAIEILQQAIPVHNPDLESELILLSGNYNRLITDKDKGLLSKSEEKLEFNKLNHALLQLAAQLPADITTEVSAAEKRRLSRIVFLRRYVFWLLLGLWALLGVVALYLNTIQKHTVRIRLDVNANRVSFQPEEQGSFQIGKPFPAVQLSQITEINVPAERIALYDDNENIKPFDVLSGSLSFGTLPDGESSLLFTDCRFQHVQFENDAHIVITTPEEDADNYLIQIEAVPGKIKGGLVFQDSLYFSGDNLSVGNLKGKQDTVFEFMEGVAYVPEGPYEVLFRGTEDRASVILQTTMDFNHIVDEQDLQVSKLSFTRPSGSEQVKSSILSGVLHFIDKKDRDYDTKALNKNEYIALKDVKNLHVTSFGMQGNTIQLQVAGEAGIVKTGTEVNALKAQKSDDAAVVVPQSRDMDISFYWFGSMCFRGFVFIEERKVVAG